MMREDSDYSDFFTVSLEDTKKQYETAQLAISLVEDYLKEKKVLE